MESNLKLKTNKQNSWKIPSYLENKPYIPKQLLGKEGNYKENISN